jgi:hypothetical protein
MPAPSPESEEKPSSVNPRTSGKSFFSMGQDDSDSDDEPDTGKDAVETSMKTKTMISMLMPLQLTGLPIHLKIPIPKKRRAKMPKMTRTISGEQPRKRQKHPKP